jgi:geranylgeranyl pyrophosphate synthase
MISDSLGGGDKKAMDLASAVEIIQSTSLIADGWIDGDLMRRGKPAFHLGKKDSETLLSIIYLLSLPYSLVGQYGTESIKELVKTHQIMSRGVLEEVKQSLNKKGLPATRIYKAILEKKTGALFSLATIYGAMSVGADQEIVEKFRNYGMSLGVLYQMVDDSIDVESVLKGEKGIGTEILLLRCVAADGLVDELVEDLKTRKVDIWKVKRLIKGDEIQNRLNNLISQELNKCKSYVEDIDMKNKEWILKYPEYCIDLLKNKG